MLTRKEKDAIREEIYNQVGQTVLDFEAVCQTEASTVAELMRDVASNCLSDKEVSAESTIEHMKDVCAELCYWAQEFIDRANNNQVKEILNELRNIELAEFSLDDEIIDLKCSQASDINNSGIEAQVEYLLRYGYTAERIVEIAK